MSDRGIASEVPVVDLIIDALSIEQRRRWCVGVGRHDLQQRAERQHGEAFDALVRRARARLYGATEVPRAPDSVDPAPIAHDV